MQQPPRAMSHAIAAKAHLETALYHCAWTLKRSTAGDTGEFAFHASMARANIVFAAHHAIEAERTNSVARCVLATASRGRGECMPDLSGPDASNGAREGCYEPWRVALLEPFSDDRWDTCSERG